MAVVGLRAKDYVKTLTSLRIWPFTPSPWVFHEQRRCSPFVSSKYFRIRYAYTHWPCPNFDNISHVFGCSEQRNLHYNMRYHFQLRIVVVFQRRETVTFIGTSLLQNSLCYYIYLFNSIANHLSFDQRSPCHQIWMRLTCNIWTKSYEHSLRFEWNTFAFGLIIWCP